MPLSAHALTTYATVKAELGLPDDTQQTAVERLINAASDAIEQFCNRHFEQAALTEDLAGYGSPNLYLSRTPVLSITSVTRDGQAVTDYVLADPEAGLLYRAVGWPWTAVAKSGIVGAYLPGTEERAIRVSYTGGYILPKDETPESPRTLPHEIEQACIETVATWWARRGGSLDVTLQQVGAAQESYGRGRAGLPDAVKELLAPWRRLA